MKSTIAHRKSKTGKLPRPLAVVVLMAALPGGSGTRAEEDALLKSSGTSCNFIEGRCYDGIDLSDVCSDFLDGPGVPLESAWVEIVVVRTMHFFNLCEGNLGGIEGEAAQMFACSMPVTPAYTCHALDTTFIDTRRFDVDRDGDLDLRDYAALQNGNFVP